MTEARARRPPMPLLQPLIGAFPGGIAHLDRELVFTYCNEALASSFGRRLDEVVGASLHDVARDNAGLSREIAEVIRLGEAYSQAAISVTWSNPGGLPERENLVTFKAEVDQKGRVCGVFMTAIQVPAAILGERMIEHDLVERNKVLEETLRQRDLLVGMVSHEIRAPLTTIFGNASLLLRRLDEMDIASRTIAISDIRQEAERLNGLVENMLLMARAGGQSHVTTEPVLIYVELNKVVADHRKRFDHRPVTLDVKPKGLMADGQPDYLKQVVQNILGNAEKYTPGDTPIEIRASLNDEEVVISILDRGPGIAADEAEIVFQPFYRSDKTSTLATGAGIGLAVCKLLVQAQSGRIWTEPRSGGGTVFSFTLPVVHA